MEVYPASFFDCNCDILDVGRLVDDDVIYCFNLCGEYVGDVVLQNIGKFLRSQGIYTVCSSIVFEDDVLKCEFLKIHNNIVMGDLVGCVKNLRFENDTLKYDTFSTESAINQKKFDSTDVTNLNGVVTEVSFIDDVLQCQMVEGVFLE